MAIIVLQARLRSGTSGQIIKLPGANWHNRFLARHSEVKLRYAQYLEKCRAKAAASIEEQRKWYKKLWSLIWQYNIKPDNIWNLDEKGIIIGLALGREKAIIQAGSPKRHIAIIDGSREFYILIKTMSASGHVIPPFVV